MRNQRTRISAIFSLAVVLMLVACQAPLAPAPAPVATPAVEEVRGVVRDLNVPGTLTSGTLVVRSAASLPAASLPWSVFQGAVPELTSTGTFSVTGLLEADGGITVDDTNFTVSGTTGAVTTASSLSVTGAANLGGAYNSTGCTVSTAGALACDGAVILDSTLAVTGTADLRGDISDTAGTLTVADNALIDGQADVEQLVVQGNNPQSNSIFVVEQVGGTDVFQVSSAGHIMNDFAAVTIDDSMSIVGQADTVQLYVTGYTTQTNVLQTWETSTGADVATMSSAGALDVASTVNYGTQNLYPLGYATTSYEIACGVTALFTTTLSVTATPLTTVTYVQVTQQTDSNANAATMTASTPSGNTFTIKSWKADGATGGSVGTQAYWCAFGPQ